ncbi:MAG: hypothetical protein ABI837_09355 [Acidobacteriota bacterium]
MPAAIRYLMLISVFPLACATAPPAGSDRSLAVPQAWQSVPASSSILELTLGADGTVTQSRGPRLASDVRVVRDLRGDRLFRGERELTPAFPAIDSFDVSEQRGEVVFSAKRTDNFDVGLVSTDGSPIHWVPEDRADETAVLWAPRGNKISYVVHAPGSDLIRTVHVPTATPLTVDLTPYAAVTALAWDPAGERFAVAYDSPDASSRVEVMKYSGESRGMAIAPATHLDVELEPLGVGIVMRPRAMRYGERLPLVVWIDDTPRPRWDAARGELMKKARVACAILPGPPDQSFWSAAGERPWIDATRVFVVGGREQAGQGLTIRGDSRMVAGHYRMQDKSVLTAPAIVKSFAAGFIAEQLKGISPANGSIR